MKTKIAIVGAGGRTGTLFATELVAAAEVVGVARHEQVVQAAEGRILVERRSGERVRLNPPVIDDDAFASELTPDFLFLTTKNPVGPSVQFYYERVRQDDLPDLILSQNGIAAADDARATLERMFGERARKVRVVRVSLFNPVSVEGIGDQVVISYFTPVRLAFGVAHGPDETLDLQQLFAAAGIEAQAVPAGDVKNMEYSKLFTNLIGVPSAAHGLTIGDGFADRAVFEEEILALREYARVVRASGGRFLNLRHFPTGTYARLLEAVPLPVLSLFRRQIAGMITKGRGSKEKGNIDEIDYYSGAVVAVGGRLGVATPVNARIYNTMKARAS
ncbi:MAG: ketopantoate reductase family protein [Candidatus Cryosericum sp.]